VAGAEDGAGGWALWYSRGRMSSKGADGMRVV
jgi:hypothetical protein